MSHEFYHHDERMGKILASSLFIHAAVIGMFALIGSTVIPLIQKTLPSSDVVIVQSSVRVDVVGMPKYTLKELQHMVPDLTQTAAAGDGKEEKAKPEKEEEVTEDSSEGGGEQLNNFLKKYSTKKIKIPPSAKKNGGQGGSKLNDQDLSKLRTLVLEGNKISHGTSLIGDISDQEMGLFQAYLGQLPDHVKRSWKLPSFLLERKDLKCSVRIYLGSRGELLKYEIYQSSGVEEFDRYALRAVELSKPYPPPPDKIFAPLAQGKVVLGFPL